MVFFKHSADQKWNGSGRKTEVCRFFCLLSSSRAIQKTPRHEVNSVTQSFLKDVAATSNDGAGMKKMLMA